MLTSYFWGFERSEGLHSGMGMKKIKVYTLTDEGASPKCIGTMKAEDDESLADLRVRLEEKEVLKFEFQYWDVDEHLDPKPCIDFYFIFLCKRSF